MAWPTLPREVQRLSIGGVDGGEDKEERRGEGGQQERYLGCQIFHIFMRRPTRLQLALKGLHGLIAEQQR